MEKSITSNGNKYSLANNNSNYNNNNNDKGNNDIILGIVT